MNNTFKAQIKNIECLIEIKNRFIDNLSNVFIGREVIDTDNNKGVITDIDIDDQGLYYIIVKHANGSTYYEDIDDLTFVED